MPSSSSSLSSFSSRLDTVCRRTCDETALTNSTFAVPIDSWFADRDDELALSLVNVFRSAESAIADVTHLHYVPQNSPHTFAIARQLNKIKGLTLDSLQARGLHDAVKEISSSFEKFGGYPPPTPSEVDQINSGEPPSELPSPKLENASPIPIPPPNATVERYPTPSPNSSFLGLDHAALSPASTDSDLPIRYRSQVAIRSAGKIRSSRKKRRATVSYALGLPHYSYSSNERTPTPFPSSSASADITTPIIEDAEAVISTGLEIPVNARLDERPPSEERFQDRHTDYSSFICRYCRQEGHRQVNCPRYFCRVCTWHSPGHLSAFCPKLNGSRLFKAKPRTWDFYKKLKDWEDAQDAKFEDHEASFYESPDWNDLDYDHNLYDNTDN